MSNSSTRWLLGVIAMILVGPEPCDAQTSTGASGSFSFTARARALVPAGGSMQSASFDARVAGGRPFSVTTSSSNSFMIDPLVAVGSRSATAPPLVFGCIPRTGSKNGGEAVHVIGANFTAGAAGQNQVFLAGVPVNSAGANQDTNLPIQTPPGEDLFGTSKGAVNVLVLNNNGLHAASEGFVYTPALFFEKQPRINDTFRLIAAAEVQPILLVLLVGPPIGGGVSIGSIEGSLQVFAQQIEIIAPVPPGTVLALEGSLPDDPLLVGQFPFGIQAIFVSLSVPQKIFSNLLHPIQIGG